MSTEIPPAASIEYRLALAEGNTSPPPGPVLATDTDRVTELAVAAGTADQLARAQRILDRLASAPARYADHELYAGPAPGTETGTKFTLMLGRWNQWSQPATPPGTWLARATMIRDQTRETSYNSAEFADPSPTTAALLALCRVLSQTR